MNPAQTAYVVTSTNSKIHLQLHFLAFSHGPGLIGAFLNVFLFGIMVTQVYTYLTTFTKHVYE